MSAWSIPPVVMASIAGYVAGYHLLVYLGARRGREHLSFSALCFAVMCYNLLCAGLYSASSPAQGRPWQVGQVLVIAAGTIALLRFVATSTGRPRDRSAAFLAVLFLPVFAAPLLGRSTWIFTHQPDVKQVQLPFDLAVTYQEVAPGPLFFVATVLALAMFGHAAWMTRDAQRRGTMPRYRMFGLALGLFFVASVNDALLPLRLYPTIYVIEYAFMGMIVVMASALTSDLLRATAMEGELRESQHFAEMVAGATPGVTYVFDLEERRAVFTNRNVAAALGYRPEEVIAMGGDLLGHIVHPDDAPVLLELLGRWQHAADGEVLTSEYRVRTREGSPRWWLGRDTVFKRRPDGSVWQIIGSAHDITERRRAEQALQESEQRYRTLVEASPSGIILLGAAGEILFANAAAVRISGLASAPELERRTIYDLVHPDDHHQVRVRLRAALGRGVTPLPFALRTSRPGGATRHLELVGIRVTYRGTPAVLGVGNDVTDRVLAEDERVRLEGQLRQAQKMEAVGRLAGGVAHDFNNLMQAILSSAEVLEARAGDAEAVSQGLAELVEHARRGARLTRQLLLFARREATRLEPLDLGAVVAEAAILMQRLLRENIALDLRLATEPLPIQGDRGQLEQVVMNLVLNAADAMPGGGTLTVRTGQGADGRPWLAIEDTGTGIAEEIRDRIFDPFFTTKPTAENSGLGLSVVQAIVTRHAGAVELETEVGRGSAFRVRLPRHTATPGPPAAVEHREPARSPGSRGSRVLVVEDERGAREALAGIMALLGMDARTVASGAEALALPVEPGFDVLLSDVLLPDALGNELAVTLKQRWPSLAIILMSGYAEDTVVREAVGRGEVRFLQKPFDTATLEQELRAVLAGEKT